ncbi:MAG: ATP-binding cassette domain-containing protein [Candidatus Korarchaeota archaeon]|nr:ATP-binding cassette domain-containing protein [Candidatus Korarchaeota archaeon]
MARVMLDISSVYKSFSEPVLVDISLNLNGGEVLGVVGPNGCGKTTLLRIMAGLELPDRGSVRREGKVGIVFQEDRLLPWKTLWENVALGLKYHGMRGEELAKRVREYSSMVGLTDSDLSLHPRKASGGTRRKAALVRALVLEPEILLLDEPFTGLDVKARASLREALKWIWDEYGLSTVIVSHQLEELLLLADRVYVLTPKPARVAEEIDLRGMDLERRLERVKEALFHILSRSGTE